MTNVKFPATVVMRKRDKTGRYRARKTAVNSERELDEARPWIMKNWEAGFSFNIVEEPSTPSPR